jgi:diguanylate cyclase (GGDEF)-like protein
MDIDDFKSVNDTYGHLAGDEVLRAVAGVLERGLRQSDLAARFGGEEFAVLLPETDATAAAAVGDRYRREIGALRIAHEGVQIGITISVGVGAYPETANTSIDDLLRAADAALYAAKEAGKNRVEVASGK